MGKRNELQTQIDAAKEKQPTVSEHLKWFPKFLAALKRVPKRLMAVIEDIMCQPPE